MPILSSRLGYKPLEEILPVVKQSINMDTYAMIHPSGM